MDNRETYVEHILMVSLETHMYDKFINLEMFASKFGCERPVSIQHLSSDLVSTCVIGHITKKSEKKNNLDIQCMSY